MKTSVMLVFAFCSVMLTPIASSTTPPGAVLEAFSRIKPLYLGHSYGRDDRSVFYDDIILNSADSSTFRLLVYVKDSRSKHHSQPIGVDKNSVFIGGEILQDADPQTFTLLPEIYAKDKAHVFVDFSPVPLSQPDAFRRVENRGRFYMGAGEVNLYTDGRFVYIHGKTYSTIDVESIQSVSENSGYSKDQNHVYFNFEVLKTADAASFKKTSMRGPAGGSLLVYLDKNHLYDLDGNSIPEVDGRSFQFIGSGYAKDERSVYWMKDHASFQRIPQAEVEHFQLIHSTDRKSVIDSGFA